MTFSCTGPKTRHRPWFLHSCQWRNSGPTCLLYSLLPQWPKAPPFQIIAIAYWVVSQLIPSQQSAPDTIPSIILLNYVISSLYYKLMVSHLRVIAKILIAIYRLYWLPTTSFLITASLHNFPNSLKLSHRPLLRLEMFVLALPLPRMILP